jgi:hypothetical protein
MWDPCLRGCLSTRQWLHFKKNQKNKLFVYCETRIIVGGIHDYFTFQPQGSKRHTQAAAWQMIVRNGLVNQCCLLLLARFSPLLLSLVLGDTVEDDVVLFLLHLQAASLSPLFTLYVNSEEWPAFPFTAHLCCSSPSFTPSLRCSSPSPSSSSSFGLLSTVL